MTTTNKPTLAFWIVSALSLVWNLMGVTAYINSVTGPETALPKWATAAFAIAVWGSTLGSILLLLRRKFAVPVFAVSFAGILVQMTHAIVIAKSFESNEPAQNALSVMVIVIGGFLVWYSRKASANGWLN